MIITEKPLFSGINEKYWKMYSQFHRQKIFLPEYWTTSPIDAIIHSSNSSRRHNSKLLVLCLTSWNNGDFESLGKGGFGPEAETEWYHRINMPGDKALLNPEVIKKEFLEIYRQDELNGLVGKYCNEEQKRYYQQIKSNWEKKNKK